MLNVNFWGVRGSTPCPCDANHRYGGNTACVVIDAPGMDPIILDLGTGLRFFGDTLPEDGSFKGTAFVTHLHWDHVQGLPFFVPINQPGAQIDIYAPAQDGISVGEAFDEFMRPPYFPVRTRDLCGEIRFHDVASTEVQIGEARVLVRDVPHVGATNGYRVEARGASVAYLSDHQQPTDDGSRVAASVLDLCRDADLVIHDAQFTPEDFRKKPTWGHCTVEYAVRVAAEAGARRLALFHHDPSRDDAGVDRLLDLARELGREAGIEEVIAASEGLSISLTPGRANGVANGTVATTALGATAGRPAPTA
jgi:phosphoribosyl 1,2-cyclic phosphodiesterase